MQARPNGGGTLPSQLTRNTIRFRVVRMEREANGCQASRSYSPKLQRLRGHVQRASGLSAKAVDGAAQSQESRVGTAAPPPDVQGNPASYGGDPSNPNGGTTPGPRGPGDPGQAPPAKINPRGYPFQGVGKGQGDLARTVDAGRDGDGTDTAWRPTVTAGE